MTFLDTKMPYKYYEFLTNDIFQKGYIYMCLNCDKKNHSCDIL